MFVGVGASRVRRPLRAGEGRRPLASCSWTRSTPSAVTAARAWAAVTTSASRRSTQLLVEMDGFELKDNINPDRGDEPPDILDRRPAAPGRFDRQIVVDRPRPQTAARDDASRCTRRASRWRPEIDLDTLHLAAGLQDSPEADLANLVNTGGAARSRAEARRRSSKRSWRKESCGGDRRPREEDTPLSEQERKITGVSRAGHAIVGHFSTNGVRGAQDPSIIGRGQGARYTISLPREDRYLTTKANLMNSLAMTLGGRAAEEIVFTR